MNSLLVFFALPLATIILSIVLQKVLKCPVAVAGIFFAIYLVVAFAFFDSSFLINTIIYTLLAYITAVITELICRLTKEGDDTTNSTATTNTATVNVATNVATLNNSICRICGGRRF